MIIVDASVLANVVGDDDIDGDRCRARLGSESTLGAPDLVDIEVSSVLRKRWLAGELTVRRFSSAITQLTEGPIERYPARPLLRRAYELRASVTPYDAMYIALAEDLDCPLLTSDARLSRAPGIRCEIELLEV